MVNSNIDALGIIFPNSYDSMVPELVMERSMASIPFASRYRLIDFMLSSMVNCGIDNVSIIARKNYRSLMDHLGSGREWDLARKNGGLNIIPPYSQKGISLYNGRVEALANILGFLKAQKEKYVVMTDCNIAVNFDFSALIEHHIESGADFTCAYTKREIPRMPTDTDMSMENLFYTFKIDDGRVIDLEINTHASGLQNLGMNIYVCERELLIEEISTAYIKGLTYFERDFLANQLGKMNVQAYLYEGYVGYICDLKSYFDENMKMLQDENVDALFSGNQIYTKIRDDNPTRYHSCATAKNVMAADGCIIEGDVENCVLFRGVKIGKGASVKNCVLMQDTVIEDGVTLDYVITDKNVRVTEGKELHGTDSFPVYVSKRKIV